MIYTSSRLDFQGDSEFPIRILKFHQWHLLWPYWCLRQIAGKYYSLQSGWFIHHPDHIFKGVLNIQSEFWNSISGIYYGYISVLLRFWETSTSTNEGDLYIMCSCFYETSWIQSQKCQIMAVALISGLLLFNMLNIVLYVPLYFINASNH